MTRTLLASVAATACAAALLPLGMGPPASAAVTQRALLRVSAGIVQNGEAPSSPDNASLLGIATFSPAHRGRVVYVQRRVGAGAWETVARRREDSNGQIRFRRDARRGLTPYSYRAFAARSASGLPRAYSNTESTAVWKLLFEDRFGGTSLDRSKWNYRDLGVLKGLRMHAESNTSAVSVSNGALSLNVRNNPNRPGYYYNGHIGTSGNFSFRYGYAAARIKFERGQGQHGGFWMQPQSQLARYGSAARTGTEIDAAEFFGEGYPDGGMASFVYSYPSPGVAVKSGGVQRAALTALQDKSDSWWSRYHVVSVRWMDDGYIFFIDGVETWRHMAHVSQRPEYLILSLLSSDWELPHLNKSTLPTTMRVDWVRAWQR